ncbi:MAG: hypothetical protein AAFV53_29760 [Myxococcota bacterium]
MRTSDGEVVTFPLTVQDTIASAPSSSSRKLMNTRAEYRNFRWRGIDITENGTPTVDGVQAVATFLSSTAIGGPDSDAKGVIAA